MQLMAGTASELGVRDRFDPELNIMGGSKYLSKMLERYGNDLDLALAAYNAGPGAVDKYGGIPQFKETKAYVDKIKKWHRLFTEIMRGGEGCPEPQKDF
jgi:soluble lytic murein transglycosylase-like protein